MMSRMLLMLFLLGICCLGAYQCSDPIAPDGVVDAGDAGGTTKPSQESPPERSKPPETRPEPTAEGGCKTLFLLDHEKWKRVERADDPYKEMAPKDDPCNDVTYKLEDGVIEVETGICSFLTVTQPLTVALQKGDTMKITYWHLALTAASSAEGYFSITIGDEEVYVNKIPIPSPPAVYEKTFTLKKDFAKGAPIYFHLHNHGSNTWKLLELDRLCQQ